MNESERAPAPSDEQLRQLVLAALDAIDADAPEQRMLLRRLSAQAGRLDRCFEEPAWREPLARLFTEVRKLRALGLWVRDGARLAFAAKQRLHLDGAIGALDRGASVPPPEGRECWIELPSAAAEAVLRTLPAGYGVVVSEPLHDLVIPGLRRVAPLRALGVVCYSAASLPKTRLDLVLLETGSVKAVQGARVLSAGCLPENLLADHMENGLHGLVCAASDALGWALRLAAHRPGRPA